MRINLTELVLQVIIALHDHRFIAVMALVPGKMFRPTPTNLILTPPIAADRDLVMTMMLAQWCIQCACGCRAEPTAEATSL